MGLVARQPNQGEISWPEIGPRHSIPAMRSISDEDIDAIALRLVQLLAKRLAADEIPKPILPEPVSPAIAQPKALPPKLAYTLKELSSELGVSKVTIYRLTQRGLLKPLPYFRTKVFARAEVERFLESATNWNVGGRTDRRRR